MRSLSVPELLGVWERGLAARPFERALSLLSAATPEAPLTELARLSIGHRDRRLLRLREWAFGSELPILVACPRCQQSLEMTVPAQSLQSCAKDDSCDRPERETRVSAGGYEVRCRPLNTDDLQLCAELPETELRRRLFARCVLDARYQEQSVGPDQLPQDVVQAVLDRVASIDPDAEIRIEVHCPDCQHRWSETFDIVSFFWAEIDAWAKRMLRDVHVLASVYGWRESDILALSAARRQVYMAMAGS